MSASTERQTTEDSFDPSHWEPGRVFVRQSVNPVDSLSTGRSGTTGDNPVDSEFAGREPDVGLRGS